MGHDLHFVEKKCKNSSWRACLAVSRSAVSYLWYLYRTNKIIDSIQSQLFLPRNQKALDGPLSFCKQESKFLDNNDRAALHTLITPSFEFEKAVDELLKRELIKTDGPRNFSIHRVVQEATNFHDIDDLQHSFDTAARLVFEQFPNRRTEETLYGKWNICQDYIPHGVHLSQKFSDHGVSGKLKGSQQLIELLSNCAWYLTFLLSRGNEAE